MDTLNLCFMLNDVLKEHKQVKQDIERVLKNGSCNYYSIIVDKYRHLLNPFEQETFKNAGHQAVNYAVEFLFRAQGGDN